MLGGLFGIHNHKQTQETPAHPVRDFKVTHPEASAIPRNTVSLFENAFVSIFRDVTPTTVWTLQRKIILGEQPPALPDSAAHQEAGCSRLRQVLCKGPGTQSRTVNPHLCRPPAAQMGNSATYCSTALLL